MWDFNENQIPAPPSDSPKPLTAICMEASLSPYQESSQPFPSSPSRNLPKLCSLPLCILQGSPGCEEPEKGEGCLDRRINNVVRRRCAWYSGVSLSSSICCPHAVCTQTQICPSSIPGGFFQKYSSLYSCQHHCNATKHGETTHRQFAPLLPQFAQPVSQD